METRAVVAAPQGAGELTVYLSCQGPQLCARWFAQALHMPQTSIRVIAKDVGGSFGLKGQPWREEVAVEIGRASCRERVCQDVSISVVAVSLKKNKSRDKKQQPKQQK